MAIATITYGTTTAATINIGATASNLVTCQHSTQISNVTEMAIDYAVRLRYTVGTTGTANTQLELWAYGGMSTTDLPHNDSDAAISATANAATTGVAMSATKKSQLKLLHIQPLGADGANATYDIHVGGIAQVFGGIMPEYFGFAIFHNHGANLAAGGALEYTSIKYTST